MFRELWSTENIAVMNSPANLLPGCMVPWLMPCWTVVRHDRWHRHSYI